MKKPNSQSEPNHISDVNDQSIRETVNEQHGAMMADDEIGDPLVAIFDPIYVRDLLRQAEAEGQHPSQLLMGNMEASAYRQYLIREYGEAPKSLRDNYLFGLQIVQVDEEQKLEVSGEKVNGSWDQQLCPLWQDNLPIEPSSSSDCAAA